MPEHDDRLHTPPRDPGSRTELDAAIAGILAEARRALAHGPAELAATAAMRDAVERAARAAAAAGLGAEALFAALDAAVTGLGHEVIPNDGEAVRAAVAALLLRARLSGERGSEQA